jgi:hypothetical protein
MWEFDEWKTKYYDFVIRVDNKELKWLLNSIECFNRVCSFFVAPRTSISLPFCGHNKCEYSSNQWNYLELLHFLSRNNEAIKRVTFSEAPKHNKLTSLNIQKDITQAIAEKVTMWLSKI